MTIDQLLGLPVGGEIRFPGLPPTGEAAVMTLCQRVLGRGDRWVCLGNSALRSTWYPSVAFVLQNGELVEAG